MTKLSGRPVGALVLFGFVSLAAVGLGAGVAAAAGVPSGVWIRNLAAWGVGALAACGLAAFARPGSRTVALGLLPLGLAASLFFPEVDGVQRWIDVGPIHLNAAMLLMPMSVVALAAPGARGLWLWALPVSALLLLVAQPDASQATSLAAVMLLLLIAAAVPTRRTRLGLIGVTVALTAIAWARPDPLAPVAEVEGIVGLAFGQSPILGLLALLALAAVAAAPALAAARSGAKRAGAALGLCLLVWALMPFLGAFPVPLVGMGMSPIIGAWLGAGLLAAAMRWVRES